MMSTRSILLGVVLLLLVSPAVCAQTETGRGMVGGGAAGAVIGGIIGHQNDETTEGALIGGAVGAIAGGLLGNQRDQQNYRGYQYQQQQAALYRQGVSFQDVVVMSQNGVSQQVIINQIQSNGVQQRPGVHDIIGLHQQGVSEPVINAMQQARMSTQPYPVVQQRPVVVEQYYQPQPYIIYRQPQPNVFFHYGHHDFHDDFHHDHHWDH